jgi:hypothetical protein
MTFLSPMYVQEARHSLAADPAKGSGGGGPDKWRGSSRSGQHLAPNGVDAIDGRASRWRDEERDAGRGLGANGLGNRWNSLSTGAAESLKLVDDVGGAGAEDFITSLPRGPPSGQ